MKNFKIFISLIVVLVMLLCLTSAFTNKSVQLTPDEAIVTELTYDEFIAKIAQHKKVNTSQAIAHGKKQVLVFNKNNDVIVKDSSTSYFLVSKVYTYNKKRL
ncbi:MAG: hypothetical protein RR444_05925 [Oscillospiraceae bacterium]